MEKIIAFLVVEFINSLLILIYSGYGFVTLSLIGDTVLAGTKGLLYGLDPLSGKVLWKDNLKGFGYSPITISTCFPIYSTDFNSTTLIQHMSTNKLLP